MTPEEFAEARKTLGWTQEQMASELNLTPHVITAIENGEARIPVPAAYGSVGAVMPFFDDKITWSDWPGITALFAVLGAAGGALLWLVHRIRGKIPGRAT